VFILQTDAKSIQCFQKHAKLIENRFSRTKVQLTRVWELLTRRWNAWHCESHCVFTAGGERVNIDFLLYNNDNKSNTCRCEIKSSLFETNVFLTSMVFLKVGRLSDFFANRMELSSAELGHPMHLQ
jgi:hypothetical protein